MQEIGSLPGAGRVVSGFVWWLRYRFNSNWVFSHNGTLGQSWLKPTNVLVARMFKAGAQIDF